MLPLEPSPPPPEPPPSGYYSPSWLFPPEGPLAGSEAAISPLVLDLDGDGIELTELGATATWFDLDADGFGERTGWVAPDDALLALDRDGNGTIDDISELFGNATTNGFIELADLDSDASGAIDLFDAQWHNLRLWIDADSDGISDDGELHTLDAFGIVSLSLAYQPDGSTLAGHLVSDVSTFSYADGSTGALVDVWFENSQVDTRFIGDWTPDPDALLLGSIRGYGTVPGLTVAMSGDPGLKDLVAAYQWRDWSTPDGALAEAEALVLRWTGADGVDPTSRGTHVDARKLATLEAFAGRGFVQENGGNTDPRWDAGAMLEASFDHVAAQVAARLALQGSLATLLVGVSYSVGADMVVGALDYDQSFAAMETIAPSLGAPLADRVGFWLPMLEIVKAVAVAGGDDGTAFAAAVDPLATQWGLPLDAADIGARAIVEAADAPVVNGAHLATGSAGGDLMVPGAAADRLEGGAGGDVYLAARGYGADTILDDSNFRAATDEIRVEAALAPADVAVGRSAAAPQDLILTIGTGGDVLTVENQFYGTRWRIEQVSFADGTVWTWQDIQARILDQEGTAGADTINGFVTGDVLQGRGGDDLLRGGEGDDTYLYAPGDGDDTIHDYDNLRADADTLALTGTVPGDVTLARDAGDPDDLLVGMPDGATVRLDGQFHGPSTRIEQIAFDDGTAWSWQDIQARIIDEAATAGDDTIDGFVTADILFGRGGNDLLRGGEGGDTYLYAAGDGHDRILDLDNLRPGTDVLSFAAGIALADLAFARDPSDPDDLLITLTGGGSVTIDEMFAGASTRIERFDFADGTSLGFDQVEDMMSQGTDGDDVIDGFLTDDILVGRAGDDLLRGGRGGDTYVYGPGDGDDSIYDHDDFRIATDTLFLTGGLVPADVTVARSAADADDLVIGINGGGSVTVDEMFAGDRTLLERVEFSDGTEWTWQEVQTRILAAAATAGDDTVVGFQSDDVLEGLGGNDLLRGGRGGDTYVYRPGDGADTIYDHDDFRIATDTLFLTGGLAPAGVTLARDPADADDLLIGLPDGGSIRVDEMFASDRTRLERIDFDDGTTWSWQDVHAMILDQAGTAGDDAIAGFRTADTIDGRGGNDTIHAGDGDDTVLGGDGADTLHGGFGNDGIEGGDGADTIYGHHGNNTIHGGAGDDWVDGSWGFDTLIGGDGDDYLFGNGNDDTIHGGAGADELRGGLGNDVITGGDGDDWIVGWSENDDLHGGAGSDILEGGTGADVFRFRAGDGSDTLTDFDPAVDRLRIGDYQEADAAIATDGGDTVIDFGAGDVVRLVGLHPDALGTSVSYDWLKTGRSSWPGSPSSCPPSHAAATPGWDRCRVRSARTSAALPRASPARCDPDGSPALFDIGTRIPESADVLSISPRHGRRRPDALSATL